MEHVGAGWEESEAAGIPQAVPQRDRDCATRRKILRVAAKLSGKRGYAACQIARVAQAAGLAPGTIYRHFANRQSLLDEVMAISGAQLASVMLKQARNACDLKAMEYALLVAAFDCLAADPALLRILREAETQTASAFVRYLTSIITAHMRLIRSSTFATCYDHVPDADLEELVTMLTGIRMHMLLHATDFERCTSEDCESIAAVYVKLLGRGLMREAVATTL
ncbi:MAG: TetR/AcrR family transcriptional regulator [Sphingobium sp.]|nr:TetR/AcrR family transcriptional regulator [Sphingobium sp.]